VNTDVDLSQLAIDRSSGAARVGLGGHFITRYFLPAGLLLGVLTLIVWASRDLIFPPRQVQVVPVLASRAPVQQEGTVLFKAAGWIEPRPTPVRVAALAPGVIEQLLVVEGQQVKSGEPIAELVKQDATLAFERAQADIELRSAELQVAQATLEAATTGFEQPVHLEADLAEAEAELAAMDTQLASLPFEIRRAEAQLAYAKGNYEGKTSAGNALAERIVDQARSEYESARALVDDLSVRTESFTQQEVALMQRRDALQKKLELRTDERRAKDEAAANVRVAVARVHQAEVALAEAKLQLDRMTVLSPLDARVLHVVAHPGSRLMPGRGHDGSHDASTVVTLYRPDMLQVRVDVRFEDLPRVQVGQQVSVSSPAAVKPIRGEVLFVSSEADIQKNTLEVKVAIEQPPPVLKPEMLVDVTFLAPKSQTSDTLPSAELRLFVPPDLVRQGESGAFVWVADQSAGIARRTAVELGRPGADGLVEVKRGLQPSSRLIATALDDLREGERIQVVGEATEPITTPSL
jgi:RND family efflux transporter MFP subunit